MVGVTGVTLFNEEQEEITEQIVNQPSCKSVVDKKVQALSRADLKIIAASAQILQAKTSGSDLTFMHSIMCQIGLPRSRVDGDEFVRLCGDAGLYVSAGKIWNGKQFEKQPIPYGPLPRLLLAHLNTLALRNKSPEIDVGKSARSFLKSLGKSSTGGKKGSLTTLQKQVKALAACSMTIGLTTESKAITYDGKPISKFEAWLPAIDQSASEDKSSWPGTVTFSHEYYTTLTKHAVPLDMRALQALSTSALAMDVYVMLADRLHRIQGRPFVLYWSNLKEQFGHEYKGPSALKNFKKAFKPALNRALAVYPAAKEKVKYVTGGILLSHCNPPIEYKATPCGTDF